MAAFERKVMVRFGDCDPGGWVFYPRYFEMISVVIEEWLSSGLGVSLPELMRDHETYTPSVHFDVDFPTPSRFGDALDFRLWVAKLGRSSCELRIEASMNGQLRMRVRQVLVFMTPAERAKPIDEAMRLTMQQFTEADA